MSKVKYSVENKIGFISIDSPPVNALDREVLEDLSAVLDEVNHDVDVVIIIGEGNKAFVAGADIKEFPELRKETGEAICVNGQSVFQKISDLKQPVIAAIDGFTLGGGLELALACDFRIATKKSQFGLPEVKLGIIPGYGGTQRLPRLIGLGKAKQLIFSGEFLQADDAYQIGLIEAITEGNVKEEAIMWANKILRNGPIAVQAAKKAVNQGIELSLAEGLSLEAKLFGDICETNDKNEGVAAFLEKREAKFQKN
ncbi:MAG TPA: enoyl-CoA hydratase [Bacillales bacterium]|nr:enoyl-CoA hydratase [Bacillales bacterium]